MENNEEFSALALQDESNTFLMEGEARGME